MLGLPDRHAQPTGLLDHIAFSCSGLAVDLNFPPEETAGQRVMVRDAPGRLLFIAGGGNIRGIGVLHPHRVIAAIDVVNFTRHPGGKIGH
jgi:hypothetical protein